MKKQQQKEEDGCIRPSLVEITKHLCENKPYADTGNDFYQLVN